MRLPFPGACGRERAMAFVAEYVGGATGVLQLLSVPDWQAFVLSLQGGTCFWLIERYLDAGIAVTTVSEAMTS